jgi:hypothetical protein
MKHMPDFTRTRGAASVGAVVSPGSVPFVELREEKAIVKGGGRAGEIKEARMKYLSHIR